MHTFLPRWWETATCWRQTGKSVSPRYVRLVRFSSIVEGFREWRLTRKIDYLIWSPKKDTCFPPAQSSRSSFLFDDGSYSSKGFKAWSFIMPEVCFILVDPWLSTMVWWWNFRSLGSCISLHIIRLYPVFYAHTDFASYTLFYFTVLDSTFTFILNI